MSTKDKAEEALRYLAKCRTWKEEVALLTAYFDFVRAEGKQAGVKELEEALRAAGDVNRPGAPLREMAAVASARR